MTQSKKNDLSKIPRTRCFKCRSYKTYINPVAKCFNCKNKFCFDHIEAGHKFLGIRFEDALVDLCLECVPLIDPTTANEFSPIK